MLPPVCWFCLAATILTGQQHERQLAIKVNCLLVGSRRSWTSKALRPKSFLVLGCGDGPDVFILYEALPTPILKIDEFLQVAETDILLWFENYAWNKITELCNHNVRELDHPILRNIGQHHGDDLLWLAIAALACVQPV